MKDKQLMLEEQHNNAILSRRAYSSASSSISSHHNAEKAVGVSSQDVSGSSDAMRESGNSEKRQEIPFLTDENIHSVRCVALRYGVVRMLWSSIIYNQ